MRLVLWGVLAAGFVLIAGCDRASVAEKDSAPQESLPSAAAPDAGIATAATPVQEVDPCVLRIEQLKSLPTLSGAEELMAHRAEILGAELYL